jgi:hypothetical protein
MSHRLVRAVAAVVLIAALAPLARAQSDAKPTDARKKEAHRHYQRAIELSHGGFYESAVNELKRAYEISPHFAVLYNLGQAYVAIGKPVDAVDVLQRYLDEGGAQVAEPRRAEVLAMIQKQQASIATLAVDTDVPGATIALDGAALATTPLAVPLRAAAGTHQVTASLEGYQSATQAITVTGQQQARVSFKLERLAAASAAAPVSAPTFVAAPAAPAAPLAAPADAQAPSPAPGGAHARRRTWGFIAAGAGVALGAGALGHFLWNRGRYETWSAADSQLRQQQTASDYAFRQLANNNLAREISNASVITVSLGVAAGAALTTGVVLILTSPRAATEAPPRVALGISPSAVTFATTF